jgi:hypothetical protein
MIEAPNRFNRSPLPPDREQVRTDQTTGDGHIGATLDHSRRRADCLSTYASSEQRREHISAWFKNISRFVERTRRQVEPFLKLGPCPLCKGIADGDFRRRSGEEVERLSTNWKSL